VSLKVKVEVFLFLIRNSQTKHGRKRPDPFNLASKPAVIITTMGVLYGQENTFLSWWSEIGKLLYLTFWPDFSIWSNQRKYWKWRHWKEGRMEVNRLFQLHFLQQTSKTFTASDS